MEQIFRNSMTPYSVCRRMLCAADSFRVVTVETCELIANPDVISQVR
jgi:hypothetical protein